MDQVKVINSYYPLDAAIGSLLHMEGHPKTTRHILLSNQLSSLPKVDPFSGIKCNIPYLGCWV